MFTLGGSLVLLDNGGSDVNFEEYYPFGNSSLRTFSYEPIEDENQIHTNTKTIYDGRKKWVF